ncbi:NYN domain-containing protein, partial [uncultured Novosphingobium sp.]|uniref:NYN domain-containing protein n=1 Tax=uncultured Novosphingobium sp. TaxID=292277 RepID=UPI00338FBC0B
MANDNSPALALLIDGDNASHKIVAGLLAEIANYGTASVKRIYGDWTKPNLRARFKSSSGVAIPCSSA